MMDEENGSIEPIAMRNCPQCGRPRVGLREGQLCGVCVATAAPQSAFYCRRCSRQLTGVTEDGLCLNCRTAPADARPPNTCANCGVPIPEGMRSGLCARCQASGQPGFADEAPQASERVAVWGRSDAHMPPQDDRLRTVMNGFATTPVDPENEEEEETSRSCIWCGVPIPEDSVESFCTLCAVTHAQDVAQDEEAAEAVVDLRPVMVHTCLQCGVLFATRDSLELVCAACARERAGLAQEVNEAEEEEEQQTETRICARCSGYFVVTPGLGEYCQACMVAMITPASPRPVNTPAPQAVVAAGQLDTMRNMPHSYQMQWESEGWSIFESGGYLEIEKDYSQNVFDSDEEAIDRVVSRAMQGSKPHLMALWFHGQLASVDREARTILPPQLLPQPTNQQTVQIDANGDVFTTQAPTMGFTVRRTVSRPAEHISIDLGLSNG